MKIGAVILLAIGLAIGTLGSYGYLFSGDYEQCRRAEAVAEERLKAASAAQGTAAEAELIKDARIETDSQEFWCRNAKQTEQASLLTGLGGIAAMVVSGATLIVARRR